MWRPHPWLNPCRRNPMPASPRNNRYTMPPPPNGHGHPVPGGNGKTLFLELLEQITPGGKLCVHTSGPSLFRKLALQGVASTLLLDEAQSLNRKGSESIEALREIFCGGISRGAVVSRCVGPNHVP